MSNKIIQYDLFDLGFNKHLNRDSVVFGEVGLEMPLPSILGSGFFEIPPSQIGSGELIQNITMIGGLLQSSNFVTGVSGWKIEFGGSAEFNDGIFRGILEAGSIHIPDQVTANSFHTDSDGNSWWGATSIGSAAAKILKSGAATFTSITITGGTVNWSTISGTANAPDDNADVTSANTAANISGQGALATRNDVGTSQINTTVIIGGKIVTGLLTADNILTGTLTARKVRSAFSGNNRLEIIGSGYTSYITWWNSANSLQSYLVDSFTGTLLINAPIKVQITADLEVFGNIVLTGTVDGVDINAFAVAYNAHIALVSAHHNKYSDGLAITPSSVTTSGQVRCGKIDINAGVANPVDTGEIVNYSDGGLDQFRGRPGSGAWIGKFDMTAV